MANKSAYLQPFDLKVNGSVVADNSKYLVGMYTAKPDARISTFDFENGEFGYITCAEGFSNTLYIFVMSTEAVQLDESFDYETWIYSSFLHPSTIQYRMHVLFHQGHPNSTIR